MRDCQQIDFGRVHDLTVGEIKACPTFAHFTDEEAMEVIETFKLFTKIAYDFYENSASKVEK